MAKMSEADSSRPDRIHAVPEGGLPLREVLAILRRRRRVIFWATTIVTTVAVLIGLQVTRTYTATAQVMIEPRESRIVSAEKVAPGLPAEDNAIVETHIKLIQSRATLARAVDNLDLLSDLAARPEPDGARPFRRRTGGPPGRMAARLGRPSACRGAGPWRPASRPTARTGPIPRCCASRRSTRCRAEVKVVQSGRSYVLAISYTSTRPQEAVADRERHRRMPTSTSSSTRSSRRPAAPAHGSASRSSSCAGSVFGSELAIEEFRATNGLVDSRSVQPRFAAGRGSHELADRCPGRALRQGSAAAEPARRCAAAVMAWNPRPRCCPRL